MEPTLLNVILQCVIMLCATILLVHGIHLTLATLIAPKAVARLKRAWYQRLEDDL